MIFKLLSGKDRITEENLELLNKEIEDFNETLKLETIEKHKEEYNTIKDTYVNDLKESREKYFGVTTIPESKHDKSMDIWFIKVNNEIESKARNFKKEKEFLVGLLNISYDTQCKNYQEILKNFSNLIGDFEFKLEVVETIKQEDSDECEDVKTIYEFKNGELIKG